MIILTLDTKKCMSSLLLSEAFDHFFFIEGEITTFGKFTMDGYMQKDFFEEPPQRSYAFWKDIRPYCFSLIKESAPLLASGSSSPCPAICS